MVSLVPAFSGADGSLSLFAETSALMGMPYFFAICSSVCPFVTTCVVATSAPSAPRGKVATPIAGASASRIAATLAQKPLDIERRGLRRSRSRGNVGVKKGRDPATPKAFASGLSWPSFPPNVMLTRTIEPSGAEGVRVYLLHFERRERPADGGWEEPRWRRHRI